MKRVIISLLISGFVMLAAATCQHPYLSGSSSAQETPVPSQVALEDGIIFIQTSNFSAIIFTKDVISKSIVGNQEYWTPSVDQVLALESQIEKYLTENAMKFHSSQAPVGKSLSNYNRQYYGVLENQTPIIMGFYFCARAWSDGSWKKGLVDARGGGDCFFYIEYDTSENTFRNIWVNDTR